MYKYMSYIVHFMYPSLLVSLLLVRFFDKAKYFEACSNCIIFSLYCILLPVSNKLRKHPEGGAKLKNLTLVIFL